MTKTRLLEAINFLDPDNLGVERVIRTAEEVDIRCGDAGNCLLSVAWSNENQRVLVDFTVAAVYLNGLGGGSYDKEHPFADVVEWFDQFLIDNAFQTNAAVNAIACSAVLDLIGVGE